VVPEARISVSNVDLSELIPESFGERIGRAAASRATRFLWQAVVEAGELRVTLGGYITIDEAPALWKHVAEILDRLHQHQRVRVDLADVELIDGACVALLVHLQSELRQRRIPCELVGSNREIQRLLTLYGRRRIRRRVRRRPNDAVQQVGEGTARLFASALAVLDFFGTFLLSLARALRHSRTLNLRDVALTMERAGADAVPIVLLINFLIGFVMAYQSAVQLAQFGANIFVADLVGLAMVRELGPLMTAIIVSGRSGAAFAAELGTMKVSEEVDALRTLGLLPLPYLVLPRVLGLALVAPLLTLLADAVGIGGGMVVAAVRLDVTPAAFMTELRQTMQPWDLFSGLLKSIVFSAAIALIACQQGLATSGGAEGVGRRTTAAVVSILFALVLLDALFTVLFGALGL
jgi:phospholipid/cholesterol/gamma-HCH transport system permease protein